MSDDLTVRPDGATDCRRGVWAVFDGGQRVSGRFNQQWEAEARRDELRRQRRRRARSCLCCGARFESEGAAHRLCDACRRVSAHDAPYSVALP